MDSQPKNGHINADAVQLGAQAQAVQEAQNGQREPRVPFSLVDLTALTVRLAQVLAEEVDCLDEMRISDIEKLQDEKARLTRAIGTMKKDLDRIADLRAEFSEEDVEAFHQVVGIFNQVLEENRSKLMVAKEINAHVVQAIFDVVREEAQQPGYNRRGKSGVNRDVSPSVTLNKTI